MYALLCAGLLVICGRLFYLQVLKITDTDPSYLLLPRYPYERISPPRGAILDRHGASLAEDRPVLNLVMRYDDLAKADAPIAVISRLAGRENAEVMETRLRILREVKRVKEAVMARAARTGRRIRKIREETLAHTLVKDVSLGVAAQLEADPQRFSGVLIRPALKRFYPQGSLAVHVLGYLVKAKRKDPTRLEPIRGDLTIVPGDRIGELGAERQFDKWLRGIPGDFRMHTDKKTGESERKIRFPAQPGRTIYLTLDATAQKRAEESLEGKTGGVVVMDVHNGEVLVMAGAPAYDNNDLAAAWREAQLNPRSRLFLSRAMRDSVPPGSVIKPIVALAGAARGVLSSGTTFNCTGSLMVGRRRRRCPGRHGRTDMVRAIEKSCNVWFYKAGLLAGPHAITAMAGNFNWGRKTGIDLPWEWPGHLPKPTPPWYAGDTVNLSIGQGNLLVTPLQVAVMMAAIANGGAVLRPHVLLKVVPAPETPIHPESFVIRKLNLPPDALRAVREGMHRVPCSGTARRVRRLKALKAAAKTGTAQIGTSNLHHAWIAGYAPWDRPRYAFAAVVHRTPGHGAAVAGPIAADVLETLLHDRH